MSWILACDDQAHITRLLQLTLSRTGWEVCTAANGEAGWELLSERETPNLIITDMQMPRLDGLGLCRRIHADLRLRHVPLILLTARGFELSADALRQEFGITTVLVKPFSPRQVLASVMELSTELVVN